jgi:hypothetical protein
MDFALISIVFIFNSQYTYTELQTVGINCKHKYALEFTIILAKKLSNFCRVTPFTFLTEAKSTWEQ